MKKQNQMYDEIKYAMLDKFFLKEVSMDRKSMEKFLKGINLAKMADELVMLYDSTDRLSSADILEISKKHIELLCNEPSVGWLSYIYSIIRGQLFPELKETEDDEEYRKGKAFVLQILRGVFSFEKEYLPFDPTKDMEFLTDHQVEENGYTYEYIHMHRLVHSKYIYEFIRIGIDITPFNTLGHIAGVHYVAMYMAKQLKDAGITVDLALVSGAAAGHDIGKYGCRKWEEQRLPSLHYYYTDLCYTRFDMPIIGHIAANHSTWDLELENLSVESLLLIYADFRVKSTRDENGKEIVNFYSLDESYSVILNKLENVDDAKRIRYQKVYDKLKDFENYMIEKGAETVLPEDFSPEPEKKAVPALREMALLEGNDMVDQIRFAALGHNMKLMSRFNVESQFGTLIEAARSERQWKNQRTYIAILGEYFTYMTEKQKLMTLKFLYEMLSNKESDIRSQSAHIMGKMIAGFSEEYKKEVPSDITLPDRLFSNLSLWDQYLEMILFPDPKMTDQHRKRVSNTVDTFAKAVLENCRPTCQHNYFDILEKYFDKANDELTVMVLLDTCMVCDAKSCTPGFLKKAELFIDKVFGVYGKSVDISVIKVSYHLFDAFSYEDYERNLNKVLGISEDPEDFEDILANMFLDDLKTGTPWIEKVTNIAFMLKNIDHDNNAGHMLHVATHLANLVKVSETISVRRAAGEGLLSIIGKMPMDQRNELAVELFNGLELGEYQFSKYIPDYLGIIMLYLTPEELDESIIHLKKISESGSEKSSLAVINTIGVTLEHYNSYKGRFPEDTEEAYKERKLTLLNMLIKAFAGYNKLVSQEAFWVMGTHIFGSDVLTLSQKADLFSHCYKKIMTILCEKKENDLDFYNNSAVLNHIYRFICQYRIEKGDFDLKISDKVAFFPGTFDPFSLGHKAVATTIRDMGFEVYLALDEFSWSKKTQPRLQRREIMMISVADEENIYNFPEDVPVNIANPDDIKRLKDLFRDKELYIAVGTDVIRNASCYKAPPVEDSIHTLNHIAFARESQEQKNDPNDSKRYPISADVINLTLKKYYEDISSTRIRENIDLNRDISNLIDNAAQNYIYDKNLYLREPAYKHVLQAKEINISSYSHKDSSVISPMREELVHRGYNMDILSSYIDRSDVRTIYLESGARSKKIAAFAAAHRLETSELLEEFNDPSIAAKIRENAAGGIGVIGAFFYGKNKNIANISQILVTEILTELLSKDIAYVIYNPVDSNGMNQRIIDVLRRQGFVNIAEPGSPHPIYAADIKSPVIIFRDVETAIKSPLNKNPAVLKAIDDAHNRLLKVLTNIYHGKLVLSFDTSAVHNKIIQKVADLNGVPSLPDKNAPKGPYMSVPFGKALASVVVPNTVTKALHTEKYFSSTLDTFTIAESRHYSALDNQARTIKSFNRPVILIDDLLHKGYRMNIIDPVLKKNDVDVKEIIVGVLTGNARDEMTVRNRVVDGAYFIPTLNIWLNERDNYPFIGGDSIEMENNTSINLILPYTSPSFMEKLGREAIYNYSMVCLENARDILEVLEEEYQSTFEKKLTLKRLGEVIAHPRRPDLGEGVSYDENLAPSGYVENDIIRLKRLKERNMI